MSGYSPYDKAPGKSSGVTAGDVAAAKDIGTMAPGKKNLVQSSDVGDPWIDGGAKCDSANVMDRWRQGVATSPGCFLTSEKRERLIVDFKLRVAEADTNFKLALESMRVDELLKKDEDINWALGFVLDVASLYIGGATTKAIGAAMTKGGQKVADGVLQNTIKTAFGKGKDGIKGAVKDEKNEGAHAEKTASLSYIKQLEAGCDVAFNRFASTAAANADDAQLVVLWEGLDPQYHSPDLYKAELTKKLERFKESGVPDIGAKRIAGVGIGPKFYEARRVVWVRGFGGKMSLYFQISQGINPSPFADDGGRMELVPDEFTDAALAQHKAKWGDVPTIADPAVPVAERIVHPTDDQGPKPMRRLQLGGNKP